MRAFKVYRSGRKNIMPATDLRSYAYSVIKKKIITCEYKPNTTLNEAKLCKELEISRTPVREALYRIEQEGLIQIFPKKGILVQGISAVDIHQVYQARNLLEPFVVHAAGPSLSREWLEKMEQRCLESFESDRGAELSRLDAEFHLYLADHCDNQYIAETIHKLWDQSARIQMCFCNTVFRFDDAQKEHHKVIQALLEKDCDKAAAAMKEHIDNCMNSSFQAMLKIR